MPDGSKNYEPSFGDMSSKGSADPNGPNNVTISIVMPESNENIDPGMKDHDGETLTSNPTWLVFFHELGGHGFLKYDQKSIDQAGETLDYENTIRGFHGLNYRAYDNVHQQPSWKNND
jgi:hypothetical protein